METGAIFDVYQDGKETFRGIKTPDGVIDLTALVKKGAIRLITNIDFDNEVENILIHDILDN
jgi:hypothetical protein